MTRSAKIMLLGAIGVGKTSLSRRLTLDRFETDYKTTVGVNVLTHEITLPDDCNSEVMRLVLWDTDGDFGQALFRTSYVLGAAGAVIVSDATRRASIEHMRQLAETFEERFPGRPVACAINKADLVVDSPQVLTAGRPALITSALTGAGVSEMFASLGAAIWRRGL